MHRKSPSFTSFTGIGDGDAIAAIRTAPAKTSPMDSLPISIWMECGDLFGHIIARLANLSFAQGKFPEMFRVGQHVTHQLRASDADIKDVEFFTNHEP